MIVRFLLYLRWGYFFMAVLKGIFTALKFLPDLIDLLKSLTSAVDRGVDIVLIKRAMKNIDKAFSVEDPVERARRINDEFRK